MIKLALLGHGPFAQPAFDLLKEKYEIVTQDEADCLIVANYGKILSQEEIDQCQFGAINIHGSILPKYRGATPIQTAIRNGDKSTGITVIKMDSKIDHGDILLKQEININPNDTTESLREKMGKIAAETFPNILSDYLSGEMVLAKQDHDNATFTNKVSVKDIILSYDSNPNKLYNYFRAYKDEPGFFIELENSDKLKILGAKLINDHFIPEIVQKPGKGGVPYSQFILGYRLKPPFNVDTE